MPHSLPSSSLAHIEPILLPARVVGVGACHLTLSPGPPFVPGWPGTPCREKDISFYPGTREPRAPIALLPIPNPVFLYLVGAEQKTQAWCQKLDSIFHPCPEAWWEKEWDTENGLPTRAFVHGEKMSTLVCI